MMESQLEDLIVGSSSCLSTPFCFGVRSVAHSDLATNYSLNNNGLINDTSLHQRHEESSFLASQYPFMAQDLGFPCVNSPGIFLPRIKQEQLIGNLMNSNLCFANLPFSLEMNSDAVNMLASSRLGGDLVPYWEMLRDGFVHGGNVDHMQQMPLTASYKKIPAKSKGVIAEPKAKMEPKAASTKRSRLEGRVPCPPFKVRKEKLGDRIAALQQLVAPFGKTDTATVLMEAIGYIKFLQNQVETLSVPYMKSSRTKPIRALKRASTESELKEPACNLKSRGLCLVPIPCLSYITEDPGGATWLGGVA